MRLKDSDQVHDDDHSDVYEVQVMSRVFGVVSESVLG